MITNNKKIRIITTVGTSLLANFTKDNKASDDWTNLKEDRSNGKEPFPKKHYCDNAWKKLLNDWKESDEFDSNSSFKSQVELYGKKYKAKASAELQSIAEIAKGYDEVEVMLLPSFTLDGFLAAMILKELLEDEAILGFKSVVRLEKPIEGLVVDKAQCFKEKGADNIIKLVTDEIYKRDLVNEIYRLLRKDGKKGFQKRLGKEWFKKDLALHFFNGSPENLDTLIEQMQSHGKNDKDTFYTTFLSNNDSFKIYFNTDLVFNISGGYKGIVPILTIIGQIYSNVDLKYLYEDSAEIITIPKMPIHFDWDTMRIYGQYLDDTKLLNLEIDEKELFEKMKSLNLISEDKTISITGLILRRYLKNSTPMDNSVIGDYFEFIVYEQVINCILTKTDKNEIITLKKGFEPDYLKKSNLGDIDILLELKDNSDEVTVFMFEAKSISQVVDDIEKVMNKVFKRLNKWKEQNENENKKVILVLSVWHFPKDSTLLEVENKLKEYKLPDNVAAEFQYTISQIEFSNDDSLSENGYNEILRKTKVNVQDIFNQSKSELKS